MLNWVISIALINAGFIHLLPIVGVIGAERLEGLYGIRLDDLNLIILMRHRALMFAILGMFLIYAAVKPDIQNLAIIAGLISALGFILIALTSQPYSVSISRIVVADFVAVASLLIAGTLRWYQS